MFLFVWGWVCAAAGTITSVPQATRLLRSKTSAGLSLTMWQLNVACSLGWVLHGLRGDWWNITVPNAIMAATAGLIVQLIIADRGLKAARVWPLVVAVFAALASIEIFGNPVLFGIAVVIPLAGGMLTQSRDLVREPDIAGLSASATIGVCAIQFMWLAWGIGMGDMSIVICATLLGAVSSFNLAWFILRTRGVVGARTASALVLTES
jgi:uncharacterized protein with PQ loop repeat